MFQPTPFLEPPSRMPSRKKHTISIDFVVPDLEEEIAIIDNVQVLPNAAMPVNGGRNLNQRSLAQLQQTRTLSAQRNDIPHWHVLSNVCVCYGFHSTASAKSRKNFGHFVFFDFRASFLATFLGFITSKCDVTFRRWRPIIAKCLFTLWLYNDFI